jgi:nucleoside-diphosphate-sugar epimerase
MAKVIVGGGTGFIGAGIVRALHGNGQEAIVLARPESDAWRLAGLGDGVSVVQAMGDVRADVLVHAAWAHAIAKMRNDPVQFENVELTRRSVDLAAEAGCRTWIGLGSQTEYGVVDARLGEDLPLRPTSIYGKAKAQAFEAARERCEALGLRFVWLRVFQAYGPMDSPERMVCRVIETLLDGKRPALTAGDQFWDYLYVEDLAQAVLALATGQASGAFNVGSGKAVQIRALVEAIRDAIDPSLELGFGEVPYAPDQVMFLEADISKLTKATGWHPVVELNSGLNRTIAWHRGLRAARA